MPIEDFALITKYGNDDISNLDQLGKASWKLRKSKAKKKIEQIAKNVARSNKGALMVLGRNPKEHKHERDSEQ